MRVRLENLLAHSRDALIACGRTRRTTPRRRRRPSGRSARRELDEPDVTQVEDEQRVPPTT